MKTFLRFSAIAALASVIAIPSIAEIKHFQPGPRLIDGSQLNTMVDALNAVLGTGTAGAIFASTLTANHIAGSDASLGIVGLASTQGGDVAVVGGTSSTSANAGGAVTITGGPPGATGVGGGLTFASGAGGATSGNGGASVLRGGAGTAGNATGGAASVVGGAGQGSAAGGASVLTGGAGGATGAGGAITITGGAGGATSGVGGAVGILAGTPISGNGSGITLTASAGVGGTNAGGGINLIPGAAVSTGIPGKFFVNGDASLICPSYYFTGTPAATTQVFFVSTRAAIISAISQVHSTAAGGTSTLDITKDSTTAAPGAGTVLTTAPFNLNATANTVQAGALSATIATITLAAGDRLAVKFNHAIQSSIGVVVTACMAPL